MKLDCICNKCFESAMAEPNSIHENCSGFAEETRNAFPKEFKNLKSKPGHWMLASLFHNIKQVA